MQSVASLQSQLKIAINECHSYRDRLERSLIFVEEVEDSNKELSQQLEDLQSKSGGDDHQDALEELTRKFKQVQSSLTNELDKVRGELESKKASLDQETKKNLDLKDQNHQLGDQVEALQQALRGKEQAQGEINQEHELQVSKAKQTIRDLEEERDSLATQLSQKDQKITELNEIVETEKELASKYAEQLEERKRESDVKATTLGQHESLLSRTEQKNNELSNQVEQLQVIVSSQKADLDVAAAEQSRLQDRLEELEKQKRLLFEENAELIEHKARLSILQDGQEQQQARLIALEEMLQEKADELTVAQATVEQYAEKLDETIEEVMTLREQVEEQQDGSSNDSDNQDHDGADELEHDQSASTRRSNNDEEEATDIVKPLENLEDICAHHHDQLSSGRSYSDLKITDITPRTRNRLRRRASHWNQRGAEHLFNFLTSRLLLEVIEEDSFLEIMEQQKDEDLRICLLQLFQVFEMYQGFLRMSHQMHRSLDLADTCTHLALLSGEVLRAKQTTIFTLDQTEPKLYAHPRREGRQIYTGIFKGIVGKVAREASSLRCPNPLDVSHSIDFAK